MTRIFRELETFRTFAIFRLAAKTSQKEKTEPETCHLTWPGVTSLLAFIEHRVCDILEISCHSKCQPMWPLIGVIRATAVDMPLSLALLARQFSIILYFLEVRETASNLASPNSA